MKNHTKVYCDFFGYIDPFEAVCEICGNRAVDVHHISPRGRGGSKLKDDIENLMGLCRGHHDMCEAGNVSKSQQTRIHLSFMKLFKSQWTSVSDMCKNISKKQSK